MTIEQIKKNIQTAEQALAEAKAKLAELEQPDDGKPRVGDTYRYLTAQECSTGIWDGHLIDKARWERGNVYKTVADAIRADKKRIVTAKLQRIADKYPPCDWKKRGQEKYSIFYCHARGEWGGQAALWIRNPSTIYASDRQYVEEALALGGELNVLLEG